MTGPGRARIALALVPAALLLLTSCGGNGPVSSGPGWRGDRFAEEVATRPDDFIGRRLNVTGTVMQIYGSDAFSLGPAGEILVLSPYEQPILPQPPAGARVIVSGELRGVTGDSLEPALRQKLDAAASTEDAGTERKAVLVARGIEVLGE